MSVQRDAWSAFLTQVQGDTTPEPLVSNFQVGYGEFQFTAKNFPFVVIGLTNVLESFEGDRRLSFPKQKIVTLEITISGKVDGVQGSGVNVDILELDEKIKNAIEKDLTLSGDATEIFVGDSELAQLDNEGEQRELKFVTQVITKRFTMGSR